MINENYLKSMNRQFSYYKSLGEKAIAQIGDEKKLFWQYNEDSNSIATIVKHLSGNMISRWTDFFTTDGEKEWRNRDGEFENDLKTKAEVIEVWNKGWDRLFKTLEEIKPEDLERIIYIRNEGHTVMEAINRQLAHYPYHVGQIVFIAKMIKGESWESLSIPRNKSKDYNSGKFAQPKGERHFTDEFLKKKEDPK
jgi:hypothetical protein